MANFCKNCGAALNEGENFCKGCGKAIDVQAAPQQPAVQPQLAYTTPPVQQQAQQSAYQAQQPEPACQAQSIPENGGKSANLRGFGAIGNGVILGIICLILALLLTIAFYSMSNKSTQPADENVIVEYPVGSEQSGGESNE